MLNWYEAPNSQDRYHLWLSEQFYAKLTWSKEANCKDKPTKYMFPSYAKVQKVVADKVCNHCPVQKKCLTLALASKEFDGVWGGSTEAERSELIKNLNDFVDPSFEWNELSITIVEGVAEVFIRNYNAKHEEKHTEVTVSV